MSDQAPASSPAALSEPSLSGMVFFSECAAKSPWVLFPPSGYLRTTRTGIPRAGLFFKLWRMWIRSNEF